jgi:hypothetical protein
VIIISKFENMLDEWLSPVLLEVSRKFQRLSNRPSLNRVYHCELSEEESKAYRCNEIAKAEEIFKQFAAKSAEASVSPPAAAPSSSSV